MNNQLKDLHGRGIRYLRISVTDRCNLRCSYCAVDREFTFIPHERILTYEEILTLVDAAVHMGIDKVRLTGGEPFARKGFLSFIQELRRCHPTLNIRITTNATLLESAIGQLEEARVDALNISFDTFKPTRFVSISGQNLYKQALGGLMAAVGSSLKVKVNCVALKGVNDDELETFVLFARDNGVDVRFIELMPLGGRGGWNEGALWTGAEILQQASDIVTLTPVIRHSEGEAADGPRDNPADDLGPAAMYSIEGSRGRIGIISPLSNHFCDSCNRLRVTADGRLRTCLFSDEEYPLRELLRTPGTTRDDIIEFFRERLLAKPIGAELLARKRHTHQVIQRGMSSIGG